MNLHKRTVHDLLDKLRLSCHVLHACGCVVMKGNLFCVLTMKVESLKFELKQLQLKQVPQAGRFNSATLTKVIDVLITACTLGRRKTHVTESCRHSLRVTALSSLSTRFLA